MVEVRRISPGMGGPGAGVHVYANSNFCPQVPTLVWMGRFLSNHAVDRKRGFLNFDSLPLQAVVVEPPGHGESDDPAEALLLNWPLLADWLRGVITTMGLQKIIIGGDSLGAGVALHLLALAAQGYGLESVDCLGSVLFNVPTTGTTRAVMVKRYLAFRETLKTTSLEAFVDNQLTKLGHPYPSIRKLDLEGMRVMQDSFVADALVAAATSDLPFSTSLSTIEVPVLLCGLTNDSQHPVSSLGLVSEALQNTTVLVSDDIEEWKQKAENFLRSIL